MLSSVPSALATTGNAFYRTASNRYFWAGMTALYVTEIAIRALRPDEKGAFVRLSNFAEGVQHSYGLIPRTPLAAVAIVADFLLPCSNKKEESLMKVRHFATQQSDKVAGMLPKVYRSFLMSLPFVEVDVKGSVEKSVAKGSDIWRFGIQRHNTPSWLQKIAELREHFCYPKISESDSYFMYSARRVNSVVFGILGIVAGASVTGVGIVAAAASVPLAVASSFVRGLSNLTESAQNYLRTQKRITLHKGRTGGNGQRVENQGGPGDYGAGSQGYGQGPGNDTRVRHNWSDWNDYTTLTDFKASSDSRMNGFDGPNPNSWHRQVHAAFADLANTIANVAFDCLHAPGWTLEHIHRSGVRILNPAAFGIQRQ